MGAWSSARASVHVLQALLVIIAKSVRVQRISRYIKATTCIVKIIIDVSKLFWISQLFCPFQIKLDMSLSKNIYLKGLKNLTFVHVFVLMKVIKHIFN